MYGGGYVLSWQPCYERLGFVQVITSTLSAVDIKCELERDELFDVKSNNTSRQIDRAEKARTRGVTTMVPR